MDVCFVHVGFIPTSAWLVLPTLSSFPLSVYASRRNYFLSISFNSRVDRPSGPPPPPVEEIPTPGRAATATEEPKPTVTPSPKPVTVQQVPKATVAPVAKAKAPTAPPPLRPENEDDCQICLLPMDIASEVEMLACGHKLHNHCIEAGLQSSGGGPRDAQCGFIFCKALFGVAVASKQEDLEYF